MVVNERHVPKKVLGQYFLRCSWVLGAMEKAAELNSDDTVLEIGPGEGALTRHLAGKVRRLIAIEKDEGLARALVHEFRGNRSVEIKEGDILKIDLPRRPYKVVANIPYYLTSRLLRRLFESEEPPSSVILMVQKEVAERMLALPPKSNLLSLAVRAHGTPKIIARVPRSCFYPQPKIESAIIKIQGISDIFFRTHEISEKDFFAVARAGFGNKRKTLVNSLSNLHGKKIAQVALEAADIGPRRRAQELSLDEWTTLARKFKD